MTANGYGVSDYGDLLECLNDQCNFKLRVGYHEKATHVICPLCQGMVVRPNHSVIRKRSLCMEIAKQKEHALKRAEKLEKEARLLRKEAAK